MLRRRRPSPRTSCPRCWDWRRWSCWSARQLVWPATRTARCGIPLVTTVLDGLVAAMAFSILVYIAGFGDMSSRVLPRSDNTAVLVAYSLIELVVVVAGILMAVIYRPDRPYRANYLLLAGGIVIIAASDRMVTYFRSVGVEGGDLWGGIGFVLGPLMLAFAVLELPPRPAPSRDEDAMDWAQLILPYSGFLGIAVLFAFHYDRLDSN